MPEVMILASGRGERLLPLTETTPKPLIEVAGQPMIKYILDLLVHHGITKIGMNLSYLGDQLKAYLGDGSDFGAEISYVWEAKPSGTAGGVKHIAEVITPSRPFWVIYADMLINFDLTKISKFHESHDGICTLCAYQYPKDQLEDVGLILFDDQTKLIEKFIERPDREEDIISQWVWSGAGLFDPKILEYIPDPDGSTVTDLPQDIFPQLLKKGERLYASPIDNAHYYQLGIDTPERIIRAEEDIRTGRFKPVSI